MLQQGSLLRQNQPPSCVVKDSDSSKGKYGLCSCFLVAPLKTLGLFSLIKCEERCQSLALRKVLLFFRGSWDGLIWMQTIWFRVKSLDHLSNVIQDGGFGHAVSAAPLEWFEPEISCMDSQSCLRGGAPLKVMETEPGVSSHVCKCSLLAHQCWEHKAAHDTLGRGNQKFNAQLSLTLPYVHFSLGSFHLYLSKLCNPLGIYQEKSITP